MPEAACPKCLGTGIVWKNSSDHYTCDDCGGRGVLLLSVEPVEPVTEPVPDTAQQLPVDQTVEEAEKKTEDSVPSENL